MIMIPPKNMIDAIPNHLVSSDFVNLIFSCLSKILNIKNIAITKGRKKIIELPNFSIKFSPSLLNTDIPPESSVIFFINERIIK